MDPLVEASVSLQKFSSRFGGVLMGVGLGGVFALERWLGTNTVPPLALLVGLGFAGLRSVGKLARRTRAPDIVHELGLFLSLVSFVYVALSLLPRGIHGTYHPLVYLALVIVSAYGRASVLGASVLWAALFEVVTLAGRAAPFQPIELGAHVVFLGLIAGFHALLYRGEIARLRAVHREHLEGERSKMRERARAYRLDAEGTGAPPEAALDSGVEEVHAAFRFALELLAGGLELRTAAVFLREGSNALVLHEAVSSLELRSGPLLTKEGLWGVALSRKEPVALVGGRASHHATFYVERARVGSIVCVPLLSKGEARGVLLCDRESERAFSGAELGELERAARFLLRSMENERVFSELSRAAQEQAKLYRASGALSTAKSEAEVIEVTVESAREVAAFDYAAVTLFHKKTATHEICAVSGEGADALVGRSFRHNAGLVSMVVGSRHALPFRGEYEPARQTVFARGLEPPVMPSLLVLPLIVHERVLGTLVLGSREKGAFHERVRPALEVLASHMAVSLANARMLRRLEEQATTDGMTGLLNKRTLIAEAEKRIRAAARFGKPLTVLVTDIDHFKRVNDTYGHDVGDVVIKGLGEVLKRVKRDTDLVGRFGGEEFVVVCEHTDREGALQFAERVRRELEGTTFQTELGPLSVTCSVGVATFPAAGQDWEALFKATDEALYVSKRSGRNQVTAWSPKLAKSSAAGVAPAANPATSNLGASGSGSAAPGVAPGSGSATKATTSRVA